MEWKGIDRGNIKVRSVLIGPQDASKIYIGTDSGIYRTEDAGENWRNVLMLKGKNRGINFLSFGIRSNADVIYAATQGGLFYSPDKGASWKRIFRGRNDYERDCTAVCIFGDAILLGTKSGLFVSHDRGRSWHKGKGEIGNSRVLSVSFNDRGCAFVASVVGVFKSQDRMESWEKIFVIQPTEKDDDNGDLVEEDSDEEAKSSAVEYLSVDPNSQGHVYLATTRGVYRSTDAGDSWSTLTEEGLLNKKVYFVYVSQDSGVYAVNTSGIFRYQNERWQEISLRLDAGRITYFLKDRQGNLYAAGEKGLFRSTGASPGFIIEKNRLDAYISGEPAISEVQKEAIKYAEVSPEKIIQWRRKASTKALLPSMSVAIDRNTTDLWHWESGSSTKCDDDTLRRGRDSLDWGISLSWDLSELIWNQDQTSIDVRSRLMVQLRSDILDEVTKLYFERIRVKMDIAQLSIYENKKRLEKEVRLRELTASIDALTGGYFSRRLAAGGRG